MKESLVNLLCCLRCQGELQCIIDEEDTSTPWREVLEGELRCRRCGHCYSIRRGIPRMVDGNLPEEVQRTVSGFGWEWEKFDDQIRDTHMTSEANFLDFIWPVEPKLFQDKVVLDAGCGMGRFLKLGAEFGSQEIIGIDLSSSVEVAYRNVREVPNAHVIQADILALPFRCSFDYIFSIGVLQFLQDPKAGFEALTAQLEEAGTISIWVYARENNGWVIRLVSPVRKHITSRIPRPALYGVSHLLAVLLYIGIRVVYKPVNERGTLRRFASLLPYNDYLYYSSRLSYGSLTSVVFDHLTPSLVKYLARDEIESWFREDTFVDISITSRNGMSWRATGSKSGLVARKSDGYNTDPAQMDVPCSTG
jgi:SAM-dependent methyltransferase